MKIDIFTFNPVLENTYVLSDDTNECVIIDPGCYGSREEQILSNFISSKNLTPVGCWLTHCHFDHMWGCGFVYQTYGLKPRFHVDDLLTFEDTPSRLPMFGFPKIPLPPKGEYIKASNQESGKLKFGNTELEVLFTPGHARGHISFFHSESKQAIVGDVIFQGSIGRTDLPGGDLNMLMRSIHDKILPLGDDVLLFPGHGPSTNIITEKKLNPYLR